MNQSQPPYRPPCSDTISCGNGPRYRHGGKSSETNIPVFLYNSTVCAWSECDDCPSLDGVTPCNGWEDCPCGNAAPYSRYALATPDAPCSAPCQTGSDCPEPPCQPCGQWNYSNEYPGPTPSYYQPQMCIAATVADGGSGYEVGDVLTQAGGVNSSYIAPPWNYTNNELNITITAVNESGAITAVKITQPGSFQTNPSSPNSMTGGHGSGASITLTFANQTMNLSPCFKYGFKNVQARRQWHGIPPFLSANPVSYYTCDDGSYNQYQPYSNTASQTKYTTAAINITQTENLTDFDNPDNDLNVSATTSWTVSVDPHSGVCTISGLDYWDPCNAYSDGEPIPYYEINPNEQIGTAQTLTAAGVMATIIDLVQSGGTLSYLNTDGSGGAAYDTCLGDGSDCAAQDYPWPNYPYCCGEYTYYQYSCSDTEITYYTSNYGYFDDQQYTIDTTITVTLSGENTSANIQDDITTLLDEWDLADDAQYPWRQDQYVSIAPLVTRNEVPSVVNPIGFGPNTNGDPTDDCEGNDPSSPDWTPTYEQIALVDPNAALHDGSIVGSPLPAGYQGTFDFNYIDYQWCNTGGPPGNSCDPDGGDYSYFYAYSYGGYVSGSSAGTWMPQNATQWTDNATGAQFPGGAWIFYNHNPSWTGCLSGGDASCYVYAPANYCIAQKWAETKMAFTSQNFARPAGDDKFSYDENNVYTINSTNTTNGVTEIFLVATDDCAAANTSPTLGSGIWGGPAVDGFFEVSGNGSPFTLGTKIFDVPSDWESESNDANACFGLLRWPNSPAILGLAAVTNVSNANGNSQLSTISLPTLGMGTTNANADYVDLYDKSLNLLAANAAVTRTDDTHFTVPVAFSAAQNTACIASNGAAPYYWDDTTSKGDYAYTDWTWWPRLICEASRINSLWESCANANCGNSANSNCNCSAINCETIYCNPFFDPGANSFANAFTQTADCLPFTPCNPSVICISPNDESFATGTTWPFKTIQFDEACGAGWQAEPQQVMQDLLYQSPHYPATAPCTPTPIAWTQDDGTCNEGGGDVEYYPHPPLVECLITLPTNGGPNSNSAPPALPNGITIGWESPANTTGNCASPENMLFPPNSVGYALESLALWTLWSNECACIDAAGSFAADYSESVLGCQ